MFRSIPAVIICFLFSSALQAQNFTFEPAASYTASLEMDVYTEHTINVYHDLLTDSAYISWRFIEDDYPEEWDIQLCDWQHCYSYIPFNGDMLGVAVGHHGFVKLLVNPMNHPGSGHLQFWIFPTGNMDAHVDIDFYFNTIVANLENQNTPPTTVTVLSASHEILIQNAPFGDIAFYSSSGAMLQKWKASSSTFRQAVGETAKGIYYVVTSDKKTYRIFLP